jgi:chromosome segregation ATPase
MSKDTNVLSEVAIFLVGVVAAGLLSTRRKDGSPSTTGDTDLRRAVTELESRLIGQESATAARFGQLESRLEEQSAKLAEVPSTQQIVGAMEQLLAKTLTSLDDRLSTQAHSIEILKTTVSQTDSLLERVLESLDSLQSYTEPLDRTEDTLLFQEAV